MNCGLSASPCHHQHDHVEVGSEVVAVEVDLGVVEGARVQDLQARLDADVLEPADVSLLVVTFCGVWASVKSRSESGLPCLVSRTPSPFTSL